MSKTTSSKRILNTKALVASSLLTAISIVLTRFFAVMVPLGGMPALRLELGQIPLMITGILFGPIAGGLAGAVADLIGVWMSPFGIFPGFTLSSMLWGIIPGLIYKGIKSSKVKLNFNVINILFILILAISLGSILFAQDTIIIEEGNIVLQTSERITSETILNENQDKDSPLGFEGVLSIEDAKNNKDILSIDQTDSLSSIVNKINNMEKLNISASEKKGSITISYKQIGQRGIILNNSEGEVLDLLGLEGATKQASGQIVLKSLLIIAIIIVILFILGILWMTRKFKSQENSLYSIDKLIFTITVPYIVISLGLNTIWVTMLYGQGFMFYLPFRILASIILLPIFTLIVASLSKFFKYAKQ